MLSDAGPWLLCNNRNSTKFLIRLLAGPELSITRLSIKEQAQDTNILKRAHDDSQLSHREADAKRLRAGSAAAMLSVPAKTYAVAEQRTVDIGFLSLEPNHTLVIPGVDAYTVTKTHDIIPAARNHLSTVFKGETSKCSNPVVVKIISERPVTAHSLLKSAQAWLQEHQMLRKLNHVSPRTALINFGWQRTFLM
jgi:molybdopterin-guanine dinucleotide biosynthesis protein